jgi:hypothetical protein
MSIYMCGIGLNTVRGDDEDLGSDIISKKKIHWKDIPQTGLCLLELQNCSYRIILVMFADPTAYFSYIAVLASSKTMHFAVVVVSNPSSVSMRKATSVCLTDSPSSLEFGGRMFVCSDLHPSFQLPVEPVGS